MFLVPHSILCQHLRGMVSDEFFSVAGSLGRLWKKNRRILPAEVRNSFAQLLLDIRIELLPLGMHDAGVEISRSRYEIRNLADLFRRLASRDAAVSKPDQVSGVCDPSSTTTTQICSGLVSSDPLTCPLDFVGAWLPLSPQAVVFELGSLQVPCLDNMDSEPYADLPVLTPDQPRAIDLQPPPPADLNVLLGSFRHAVTPTISNQTAEAAGAVESLRMQIATLHEQQQSQQSAYAVTMARVLAAIEKLEVDNRRLTAQLGQM